MGQVRRIPGEACQCICQSVSNAGEARCARLTAPCISNDAVKCAENLQKLLQLRRERGDPLEVPVQFISIAFVLIRHRSQTPFTCSSLALHSILCFPNYRPQTPRILRPPRRTRRNALYTALSQFLKRSSIYSKSGKTTYTPRRLPSVGRV